MLYYFPRQPTSRLTTKPLKRRPIESVKCQVFEYNKKVVWTYLFECGQLYTNCFKRIS